MKVLKCIFALIITLSFNLNFCEALSNGWYKIFPAHESARVLDVSAAGTSNGTNLQIWDDSNVPQQRFYLENKGNGYVTLKAGHYDLYVTAANSSGNAGTNVVLMTQNNSNAQLWLLIDGGNGYYIESALKSNLVFDCEGGGRNNGNNVQLWTKENVNWHKWRFVSVGNPIIQQPQQNNTSSYDNKVKNFINNPQFSAGSSKTWDCFAYATQFVKNVHGYSGVRNGQYFNSPNQIRSGDVVHVKPRPGVSENPHWIIVLYRNGSRLTTIEGNWDKPKVNGLGRTRYSETDYYIQGNHFCRGNSVPFRSFDCGYHY